MECERKSHGCDEPHVGPRWHGDERLVLRQAIEKHKFYYNPETAILMLNILRIFFSPIHGIQHFNSDQHRESHSHGMRISKDLAVNALEFASTANTRQVMSLYFMQITGITIRK